MHSKQPKNRMKKNISFNWVLLILKISVSFGSYKAVNQKISKLLMDLQTKF